MSGGWPLQFVWWSDSADWRILWARYGGGLRLIYRWSLCLGPLEIRRWTPAREAARLTAERAGRR